MDESYWWELLRDLQIGKLSAVYVHKKILGDVEKITKNIEADRDRWKERCEAAESVVSHAVDHMSGYCETLDQYKAYYESWQEWQKLKSEMEAE